MKLLAIDTATEACSAALIHEGEIITRAEIAPRMHAELLLPMVDQLLAEAEMTLSQLDALAFGRGPGAFTGVRVATGVIQGLAYASDLPVAAVSSLAILAQSVADTHQHIVPAFDARMSEVYIARYSVAENGLVELQATEQVIQPEQVSPEQLQSAYGVGSGWQSYGDILSAKQADLLVESTVTYPNARYALPLAQQMVMAGNTQAADAVRPVYLRNKVTF